MIDKNRTQMIDNIRIAMQNHNNETDILKIAIELIDSFSEDFNWTGFYMMKGNILKVGPYIGPKTEHKIIELNKGICGAAASKKESIIVDNVQKDNRFLTCSSTTRSEIVVPLMDGNRCLGEIDIDSNCPSNFKKDDKEMLEEIAEIVVKRLKVINNC